jgi:hypothetical protein
MTLNVGDYFERTVSDTNPTFPNFIKGYRGRVARYDDGCIRDEDGCGHSVNCVRKIDPPNVGPVRTVTRKEIVPGAYGIVRILAKPTNDAFPDHAHVRIDDGLSSPADLRAAAATLTEIADALEQTP